MIGESTLEHYIYYLRRVEGDDHQAIRERRDAFEKELGALLTHLERLSGQVMPAWEWPEESQDRFASQFIVRTDWQEDDQSGRARFVAACVYGDVYWLQVGYAQRGQAGPEIFTRLRDETWQPFATEHLLGSSVYLCGIAADASESLAADTLKAYSGDATGAIHAAHLANGCAGLYGSPQQPYATAILFPDEKCEAWAGHTILNNIAPRLELYKHKADRQLTWCRANWPTLTNQEQELRRLSTQTIQLSPSNLEPLQRLIQLYRIFGDNVSTLIERQIVIGINLDNLEAVLEELEPLAEDDLLSATRDRLRQRLRQLETDLRLADQTRQKTDTAINTLRTELALGRLVDLQLTTGKATPEIGHIARTGFPGASPQSESIVPCPRVSTPTRISLATQDKTLLQHVFRGYDKVLVEERFSGGYSGTKVLLTLPVKGGLNAARKVTKLGFTLELRRELENYEQYVKPFLPFCTAGIERDEYYEHNNRAGLNYYFVGGGALGQVIDLEQYYRTHTADQTAKTLSDLLDRELQSWYRQATPLEACYFSDEYGRHIVEHLRLELDALWTDDPPSATMIDYRRIEVDDIPREHAAIRPGTPVWIEGLVVTRIKRGEVKLQAPDNPGTVVRVQFDPESKVTQALRLESVVNVRGEVIHNRRGRLGKIVRTIFPDLKPGFDSPCIELPGVLRAYPNPLLVYPEILDRTLDGRASFVHGDLHLRNILVDERGEGWLIDFAKVEKRHILFDFIKLEVYIRLMGLTDSPLGFSMHDYTLFEEALAEATLEKKDVACPRNQDLQVAYRVILAIRRIARHCMAQDTDFLDEYFPALFLYCLAVTKYFQEESPEPTRLAFATASVLGHYLAGIRDWPCLSSQPSRDAGKPSSPQPAYGTGNRWAVLVGVDEYEDKANYGRLSVCAQDVKAIRAQLVAGDFCPNRIRLLTDHKPDELPTRVNILTALKAVADATEPDDLMLFYYSGHGDEKSGESYLVARDGRRLVLGDTAVAVSRIKQIVEEAPARAKVIILDACHSGADIGGKGPQPMSAEFIRRVFEEAEGMAILASCKQGQLSYEWRAQEHSVFTRFLLEALAGKADRDEKRFVTVQDVSRYVTDGVKVWASQNDVSQTPTLQYAVAGDLILVRYA